MPCTVGRYTSPNNEVTFNNAPATASNPYYSIWTCLACGNSPSVPFPLISLSEVINDLHLNGLHSECLGKFIESNSNDYLGTHLIPQDNYFSEFSVDHARKTIFKNSYIRLIDINTDSLTINALDTLDEWCRRYTTNNIFNKFNSNTPRKHLRAYLSCPLRTDKTLRDEFPDCFYLAGCWLHD